jgi:hypothetical protein
MATLRLLNSPSDFGFPAEDDPTYSGNLIESLLELLENHTKRDATSNDTSAPAASEEKTAPLTIDEVLRRSGLLGASRPVHHTPSSDLQANR